MSFSITAIFSLSSDRPRSSSANNSFWLSIFRKVTNYTVHVPHIRNTYHTKLRFNCDNRNSSMENSEKILTRHENPPKNFPDA